MRYCSVGPLGATQLGRVLRETPYDVLWLNGFFDREFTIPTLMRRRSGLVPVRPTLISPRGEFGSGALGLKSGRKRAYLSLVHRAGLLHGVALHATNEDEKAHSQAVLPKQPVEVAPNIRLLPELPPPLKPDPNRLRIAFVGRIARIKNLDFALEVLKHVKAPVRLEILGPAEDAAYWSQCQEIAAGLPPYIEVVPRGEVANKAVSAALAESDIFLLPTRGENFGHAIFEALAHGVPALISDATPWRDLENAHAGWNLPLNSPLAFAERIDAYRTLSAQERAQYRLGARRRAERWVNESGAIERNASMLYDLVKQAEIG